MRIDQWLEMVVIAFFNKEIERIRDRCRDGLRYLEAFGRIVAYSLHVADHFVDEHFKRIGFDRLFFEAASSVQ